MIPQLFSPTSFVLEGFQTQCSFNYIDRDLYTRSFMTIMFFGGLILPLFIKIVFYIQIWYVLKSNEFFINYTLKLAIKSNENVYETTKNEIKLNEISSRNENVKFIKKSIGFLMLLLLYLLNMVQTLNII